MRNSMPGLAATLIVGFALAACGNDPEPLGPVDRGFDSTVETIEEETDEPLTAEPERTTDMTLETEPGVIPEVMEDRSQALPQPDGDTTSEMFGEPEDRAEDPLEDESGAPL